MRWIRTAASKLCLHNFADTHVRKKLETNMVLLSAIDLAVFWFRLREIDPPHFNF
jgi:hypothetical protein